MIFELVGMFGEVINLWARSFLEARRAISINGSPGDAVVRRASAASRSPSRRIGASRSCDVITERPTRERRIRATAREASTSERVRARVVGRDFVEPVRYEDDRWRLHRRQGNRIRPRTRNVARARGRAQRSEVRPFLDQIHPSERGTACDRDRGPRVRALSGPDFGRAIRTTSVHHLGPCRSTTRDVVHDVGRRASRGGHDENVSDRRSGRKGHGMKSARSHIDGP